MAGARRDQPVDAISPVLSAVERPRSRAARLGLAESLQTFVSDSDPAEPFYRLARHILDSLFAGGAPGGAARAYFDIWILQLSGLFRRPAECAGCEPARSTRRTSLFDGHRPGFVGPECRARAKTVAPSPAASNTPAGFLASPFDPKASRYQGIAEASRPSPVAPAATSSATS